MANAKQRRQLKEAQRQLNTKLKLERGLASNLRRFFAKQNAAFVEAWQASRSVFDAAELQGTLKQLLEEHYRKAGKSFKKITVESVNRAIDEAHFDDENDRPDHVDENDPELLLLLSLFALREASNSAAEITDTSNREIRAALEATDNDTLRAHSVLRQRAMARSQSIAVTENQKACEGAKQSVSIAVSTAAPAAILPGISARKTWMTQMDMKVREPHQAALFQERPIDKPFDVGGEQLMFPGDWTMGASLWNVIMCRCTAIHDFFF